MRILKNTFGTSLTVTLFGESHGEAIGAVLDGLSPGITVDCDYINSKLALRRASSEISTARREGDEFKILSGVFNGKTTGTPLCIVIENSDKHSSDYSLFKSVARPGHADYTAEMKYGGFQDYRGGGHFSGRITAPLVAAGAILLYALNEKGIAVGTHLLRCGGISDRAFSDINADISRLDAAAFPVLDESAESRMIEKILEAKRAGDSVGGVLETAVTGIPAGVGEPWFDTLEGVLSHALFSIPAIKGVEFGAGFMCSEMRGSEMNDPFYTENGTVKTSKNDNGGINGGISNGMPIIFRTAVKPTPSIAIKQNTVNFKDFENAEIAIVGRHDPCIAHRARVVQDAVTALVLGDMLLQKYGTDFLR